MNNLDSLGFKFKVGDVVYHRLGFVGGYREEMKNIRTPMLIIERIASECVGGIQLHYGCRVGISGNLTPITLEPTKLYNFNEIELEA